jgi:hypothetical protein
MERRNLLAGLLVLAACMFLVVGSASARGTTSNKKKAGGNKACVVNTLPSFVAQGEAADASSVADIIEVECEPGYEEAEITISSQELFERCHTLSWARIDQATGEWEVIPTNKEKVTTILDDDDNATVVVWGGPSCASGSSLISVHLNESPALTFTSNFEVLQPKGTPPGLTALDVAKNGEKVEDATFSDVATILQLEAPASMAEKEAVFNAEELYFDCGVGGLRAYGPDEIELFSEEGVIRLPKASPIGLNDNGNAFVVLLAGQSCTPAVLEFEASVDAAPLFPTWTTTFEVKEPQPTR